MRALRLTICSFLVLLFVVSSALGDWFPEEPYKMHYPQEPNATGWDICLEDQFLADDFTCSEGGFITDIHFWISWMDEDEGDPYIDWDISIWDDVGGAPGTLQWQLGLHNIAVIFYGQGVQGWFCPSYPPPLPNNHDLFYQVNITEIVEPWEQVAGTTYWLVIRNRNVTDPYVVGWKSSASTPHQTPALWSPDPAMVDWSPINLLLTEVYDLAFVITGHEETYDYGDAPESTDPGVADDAIAYPDIWLDGAFPTCETIGILGFVRHNNIPLAYFGPSVDGETDGDASLCPPPGCFPTYDDDECYQDGDAGLINAAGFADSFTIDNTITVVPCIQGEVEPLGTVCQMATWGVDIDIDIFEPADDFGSYVNVLADWGRDGMWSGASDCWAAGDTPEHILVDFWVPDGYVGPLSALGPPAFRIGPEAGHVWFRFTISDEDDGPLGDDWNGEGDFVYGGETEDYLLLIEEEGGYDYGDAPESEDQGMGDAIAYPDIPLDGAFPTCETIGILGFVRHDLSYQDAPYFGPRADGETDGDASLCPPPGCFPTYDDDECYQDGDAGLVNLLGLADSFTIDSMITVVPCMQGEVEPLGPVCQMATWGVDIDIDIVEPADSFGSVVNVLADWNRDGMWSGTSDCWALGDTPEHILVNFPVPDGYVGPLSGLAGIPGFQIGPEPGHVWFRFTITDQTEPVSTDWNGEGDFDWGGETEDYLLLVEEEEPEELDFGDAPEGLTAIAYPWAVMGSFPTCATIGPAGHIQHGLGWAHFVFPAGGMPAWDPELDGDAGLCPGCFPTYDDDECFMDGDAGLIFPEAYTIDALTGLVTLCPAAGGGMPLLGTKCTSAAWGGNVDIWVVNGMPVDGYVNVLMDWNQDGLWAGIDICPPVGTPAPEHVLVDWPVPMGYAGPLSMLPVPPPPFLIGSNSGHVWSRFSITERPVGTTDWNGEGTFEDGETEDYLLLVDCPCHGDTTDSTGSGPPDGTINFGDLMAIYNQMTAVYPTGDPTFVYDIGRPAGLECADISGITGTGPPDGTINFGDLMAIYNQMTAVYPTGDPTFVYDVGCPF